MAAFLSKLFGNKNEQKKNGNFFSKDNFYVIEADYQDGSSMLGSIDFAYKNFIEKAKYPWCLEINIALKIENCTENTLPIESESKIANKLEDELLKEIQKIEIAHYIGHIYNDNFLDCFIYLNNPEEVNKYLQTQVNKEGLLRGFGYKIKQDPTWEKVETYFNM